MATDQPICTFIDLICTISLSCAVIILVNFSFQSIFFRQNDPLIFKIE